MNKTTKHLLLLTLTTTPLIYILWPDHGQKPHQALNCFYCSHTGKILFGSLALSIGSAVYVWKNWNEQN